MGIESWILSNCKIAAADVLKPVDWDLFMRRINEGAGIPRIAKPDPQRDRTLGVRTCGVRTCGWRRFGGETPKETGPSVGDSKGKVPRPPNTHEEATSCMS